MAKHAVVISLDAMGSADLKARLQFLPNLSALVAGGTWVRDVKGNYHGNLSKNARRCECDPYAT